MANNNQQYLIFQMTAKGKLLTSGMEKWINEVEAGECPKTYAYYYALGCLGGDYINKRLINTKWLPQVVDELSASKFMKAEKAEGLKAEWEKIYKSEPEQEKVPETKTKDAAPEPQIKPRDEEKEVVEESAAPAEQIVSTHPVAVENAASSAADDDDSVVAEPLRAYTPTRPVADEPTVEVVGKPEDSVTRISFVYDQKTGKADPSDGVPAPMMGLFYEIMDSKSAAGVFPAMIEHHGRTWVMSQTMPKNGVDPIRYSYSFVPANENDFIRG